MRKRSLLIGVFTAMASAVGLGMPAAAADDPTPMIVGGQDATETYSFMTSMQTKDGKHNCGAALISPEWLVTAAHCVTNPSTNEPLDPARWQYRINTTDRTQGGEVITPDEFIPHEKWSWQGSGTFDIALVHLSTPAKAAPIDIADSSPGKGTEIRELGWGQTCPTRGCSDQAPVTLQQLDTTIAADSACTGQGAGYDPASELCMDNQNGEASACYGDSGGPAIIRQGKNWALVGATSRGQSANCPEYPGIYTDVTAYQDWINQHTNAA